MRTDRVRPTVSSGAHALTKRGVRWLSLLGAVLSPCCSLGAATLALAAWVTVSYDDGHGTIGDGVVRRLKAELVVAEQGCSGRYDGRSGEHVDRTIWLLDPSSLLPCACAVCAVAST